MHSLRIGFFSTCFIKASKEDLLDEAFYDFMENKLLVGKVSPRDCEVIRTVLLNNKMYHVYSIRVNVEGRIVFIEDKNMIGILNYDPHHDRAYKNSDGSLNLAQLKADLRAFLDLRFEVQSVAKSVSLPDQFSFLSSCRENLSLKKQTNFETFLHQNRRSVIAYTDRQSQILNQMLAQASRPMTLSGSPGSGKSTLGLSYILELLEAHREFKNRDEREAVSVLKIAFCSPGEAVVNREQEYYQQQAIARESGHIVDFIHLKTNGYSRKYIERWIQSQNKQLSERYGESRLYHELMNLVNFNGNYENYTRVHHAPDWDLTDNSALVKLYTQFKEDILSNHRIEPLPADTYDYIVIDEAQNIPAHNMLEFSKVCSHRIVLLYDSLQGYEWMGIPNVKLYKQLMYLKHNIVVVDFELTAQHRNAPIIHNLAYRLSEILYSWSAEKHKQKMVHAECEASHAGDLRFFQSLNDKNIADYLDRIKNTNKAAILTTEERYSLLCDRFPEHFILTPQMAQGRDLSVCVIDGLPWDIFNIASFEQWQNKLSDSIKSTADFTSNTDIESALRMYIMLVTRGVDACWICRDSIDQLPQRARSRVEREVYQYLTKTEHQKKTEYCCCKKLNRRVE
ncbi:MAG: hypothetical protein FJ161_01470 [Gammaproteobacteria bacterium]|nr:hypothetical protein [Gammaproteobacteria bacterium]